MFPSGRDPRQPSSSGRSEHFYSSKSRKSEFKKANDYEKEDWRSRKRKRDRYWNHDRRITEEENRKNYSKACEVDDYERRREAAEKRLREEESRFRDDRTASMRFGALEDSSSDDGMPDMSSPVHRRSDESSDSDVPLSKKKKTKVFPSGEEVYEPLTKLHMSGRPPFITCKKANSSEKFEFAGFIPQSRPKRPPNLVHLDSKELKTERVENYYKSRSFGEIENGIFKLDSVSYDPLNAQQRSRFEPVKEPEIEWDLKDFTDFQAIAFLQRSVFSQSLPSKRRKFLEILKNCSGRTRQMKAVLWIKIIELEDEIWKEDGKISGSVDTASRKLAMIKTALEECRGNMDLELYKIDVVAEKYGIDNEETRNSWETLINKYPNNLEMWKKYVSFHRSKKLVFDCLRYEKYVTRCLEKLGSIISGEFKSHKKEPGTEDLLTDVIISLSTMWIESGRTHKVIALIQAYVEFYLFPPEGYSGNFRKLLDEFKKYWESSIVKPGHPEAKGWRESVKRGSTVVTKSEEDELREIVVRYKEAKGKAALIVKDGIQKENHDVMIWRNVEKIFTEYFWEPFLNKMNENVKSMLMVYSYVSFDEIKPFFIEYPSSTGLDYPLKIIFSLLSKFGVIFPSSQDFLQEELCQEWSDCFLTVFPLEYKGIEDFLENILKLISFSNNDLAFRCLIGIITTKRRELEKRAVKSGGELNLTQASKELLEKTARYLVFFNPMKSPNPVFCQYKNLYLSFVIEQV
ncbi:hypothetical protein FO519_008125 [Halicephalobus sp. NKZ332]|nr:hypothetical protein FO519_008125 [Halicephalobus sp. NKZ332]